VLQGQASGASSAASAKAVRKSSWALPSLRVNRLSLEVLSRRTQYSPVVINRLAGHSNVKTTEFRDRRGNEVSFSEIDCIGI
jgi:hypothetical protein